MSGPPSVARLLLVQYPNASAAADDLVALAGNRVEGLVATDVHEALRGAVFGEADAANASSLLTEALASK